MFLAPHHYKEPCCGKRNPSGHARFGCQQIRKGSAEYAGRLNIGEHLFLPLSPPPLLRESALVAETRKLRGRTFLWKNCDNSQNSVQACANSAHAALPLWSYPEPCAVRAISAIEGLNSTGRRRAERPPWASATQKGRRRLSAAARRKLSRLLKQRWAQGKMKPRA